MIEELIEKLTPFDLDDVFIHSCKLGKSAMVEKIMKYAINSKNEFPPHHWNGRKAFLEAIENDQIKMAELFINHSSVLKIDFPPKNWNANEAFDIAVSEGKPELVEMLIKFSDTLNVALPPKNWNGNKAFMSFCNEGKSSMVKVLIKHSAKLEIDLNPKVNDGWTSFPLAYIKFCEDLELEKMLKMHFSEERVLLDNDSKYIHTYIEFPPKYWNPNKILTTSIQKGQSDLLDVLIKHSTDLNIDIPPKNWHGNEAFRKACKEGHLKMSEVLIRHASKLKIDLSSKVNFGWTYFPLDDIDKNIISR